MVGQSLKKSEAVIHEPPVHALSYSKELCAREAKTLPDSPVIYDDT